VILPAVLPSAYVAVAPGLSAVYLFTRSVHHVLKWYGQEVKLFKLGRLPAQMLIDKSKKVRFVH